MQYEGLCSEVSNSTQVSAIMTAKGLTQLESESIEAQLDRINFTLIDLLKPDAKEFADSFSFQGYDAFMSNEDDIIENIGEIIQKYDRSLMMLEDFFAQGIREENALKKVMKTQCRLKEIYALRDQIEGVIKLVENGLAAQVNLNVGDVKVIIQVVHESVFGKKTEIRSGFVKEIVENQYTSYIRQLENEVEELEYKVFHMDPLTELDGKMYEAYTETFSSFPNKIQINPLCSYVDDGYKHKILQNFNRQHQALINELQWECSQNGLVRLKFESKMQELDSKENAFKKKISDFQTEISKKIKSLDLEKQKIRTEKDELYKNETAFHNKIKSMRDEISVVKDLMIFDDSFVTPCTTPKNKENSVNTSAIIDLENPSKIEDEIRDLELELESSSEKGSITFKINHLKNKLSAMRSERILNTSANIKRKSSFTFSKNSNKKLFLTRNLDLSIDIPRILTTPNNNQNCFYTGRNTDISYDFSPLVTQRSGHTSDLVSIEKDENFMRMLELKEGRLRKKEEELHKKEISLQATWMKLPNADQLIPMVQKEILEYQAKSKEIHAKQGEIDKNLKESIQLKKKLKKIESQKENFLRVLEEKSRIAQILDNICAKFEDSL